ncbi:MAG: Kae1-associated serine/threonine protein kinase [Candidatus Aenigmarchaeota archaeon]|nr:Kae1-associated serine/threonine protein kinase [Candidatus Aenigmarchaeota archaeon]
MKEIKRGAEAIIWLEGDQVIKERIKKSYRLQEIDEKLRKYRTRKEGKLLLEVQRIGVDAPNVSKISEEDFKIKMDYVEGTRLKELFSQASDEEIRRVSELAGKSVGILHKNGIVHGDLTTSNMILKDNRVFFIDFGLGENTSRIENLATDLSVLKEAFRSTHFKHLNPLWDSFIKGYKQTNDNFNKVLETLNDIEKRGRYVRRNE